MSWVKEIGMIMEGWDGVQTQPIPRSRYVTEPEETVNKGWSYNRGVQTLSQNSLAADSLASGNNPYEQEEEPVTGVIGKSDVIDYINSLTDGLDQVSQLDRSAIMALSKIKEFIKNGQ